MMLFRLGCCSLLACALDCGGTVEVSEHSASGQDAAADVTAPEAASDTPVADAGCAGWSSVAIDNAAPVQFASVCNGTWGASHSSTAVGYIFTGGPVPGVPLLEIEGCANSGALSAGIHLMAAQAIATGTFTIGQATYTDNTETWGVVGDPFQLIVTRFEPAGGVIEGTFEATVTHGGNAGHIVTGSFHVCHVTDELAP